MLLHTHVHRYLCTKAGGIGLSLLWKVSTPSRYFQQLAANSVSWLLPTDYKYSQTSSTPTFFCLAQWRTHACLWSVAEHKSCDICVACALQQSDKISQCQEYQLTVPDHLVCGWSGIKTTSLPPALPLPLPPSLSCLLHLLINPHTQWLEWSACMKMMVTDWTYFLSYV